MPSLVLTAAITGGGPPRAKACWQPADTDAIVAASLAAEAAGAAIIHLHARDDATGATTTDPVANAALLRAIRAAGCRAILNLSAGDDGGRANHSTRAALVGCGAEIVSLAGGSFNTGTRLYDNAPVFQRTQARSIAMAGAVPEIEVFDTGHLAGVYDMLKAGLVRSPPLLCLVFGVSGGMVADPDILGWLVSRLPPQSHWCVSAQGDDATATASLLDVALALGGHVRTGIEDSVWLRPGQRANSTAEQVAFWADRGRAVGRSPITPAETRRLLHLPATAK